MTTSLFVLGFVLFLSGGAGILVAGRFQTVGRSRTSTEVMRLAFPISGVGTLLMIPYALDIGMGSAVQDVLMVGLLILWAVAGGAIGYFCTTTFRFAADDSDARPFFSRRPRPGDPPAE
jgi:hypothetical protein